MAMQRPALPGQDVVFSLKRGFPRPLILRGAFALVIAGLAAAAAVVLGPPMFVLAGLCGLFAVESGIVYVWRRRLRAHVVRTNGRRVSLRAPLVTGWQGMPSSTTRSG